MGLDSGLTNIGIALSVFLQPRFYTSSGGLGLGMWIGVIACIYSLCCGTAALFIDRYRVKKDRLLPTVLKFIL